MSENRIRKTDTVQTHGPASAGIWVTTSGKLKFNYNGTPQAVSEQLVGAAVTADGALGVPTITQLRYVTKAGVAAMTLAAPVAADEGVELEVKSTGAYAHTITATGLLQTGAAATDVATFAAYAGAGVRLRAKNLKWQVVYSVGVTFS